MTIGSDDERGFDRPHPLLMAGHYSGEAVSRLEEPGDGVPQVEIDAWGRRRHLTQHRVQVPAPETDRRRDVGGRLDPSGS